MKTCTKCNVLLGDYMFYKNAAALSGLASWCRLCSSAGQMARHNQAKLLAAEQAKDEVDFMRILVYLRACRSPPSELTKVGIVDAWNAASDLQLPRMSDRGSELKNIGAIT